MLWAYFLTCISFCLCAWYESKFSGWILLSGFESGDKAVKMRDVSGVRVNMAAWGWSLTEASMQRAQHQISWEIYTLRWPRIPPTGLSKEAPRIHIKNTDKFSPRDSFFLIYRIWWRGNFKTFEFWNNRKG